MANSDKYESQLSYIRTPDGKPSILYFKTSANLIDYSKPHLKWHENGVPAFIYSPGNSIALHPNGNIAKKVFPSKQEEFYISGNVKSVLNIDNISKKANRVEFYDSGMLKSKSSFIEGTLHGNTLTYGEDGKLIQSKSYIMGVEQKR